MNVRAALAKSLVIFCISMISVLVVGYIFNDASYVQALLISVMVVCMTIPIFLSMYKEDGNIIVDEAEDGSLRFTIECNEDPEEWVYEERIMLTVKRKEHED